MKKVLNGFYAFKSSRFDESRTYVSFPSLNEA
jgi:hypothetical protein